jgi:collagenase-like PrtC family protease
MPSLTLTNKEINVLIEVIESLNISVKENKGEDVSAIFSIYAKLIDEIQSGENTISNETIQPQSEVQGGSVWERYTSQKQ